MPNPRKWPPKVQNHKGTARARNRAGKYHYFGKYGSPEATAAFARWLPVQDGAPPPPKITLADLPVPALCAAWRTAHAGKTSPTEARNYAVVLRALERTFPALPAREFDAIHLEDFQLVLAIGSWLTPAEKNKYLKPKGRGPGGKPKPPRPLGMARAVVNRQIVRVKGIWKWAERRRLVPKGSYAGLLTVSALRCRPDLREGPGVKPSRYDDVLKVAQYCPDAVACMLELQWWAGMRSGEVRIVRTVDIDQTDDIWVYRPHTHKNKWRGQDRAVLLGPECQKLLAPWLKPDLPSAYLFVPDNPRSNSPNPCYTSFGYTQAVRRACARAGVKVLPYSGRHAAKDRITREHGLDVARILLGQKSIMATDRYGDNADLETAKAAVRGRKTAE